VATIAAVAFAHIGLKFPVRVVPGDDPVALLVEEAFEGGGDLIQVAHEGITTAG
jgi:hypothetical protein